MAKLLKCKGLIYRVTPSCIHGNDRQPFIGKKFKEIRDEVLFGRVWKDCLVGEGFLQGVDDVSTVL